MQTQKLAIAAESTNKPSLATTSQFQVIHGGNHASNFLNTCISTLENFAKEDMARSFYFMCIIFVALLVKEPPSFISHT